MTFILSHKRKYLAKQVRDSPRTLDETSEKKVLLEADMQLANGAHVR